MKEYEIVSIISEGYGNRYVKILEGVVSSITNKYYDMLNLEVVKLRMDETFKALQLKVRFDELCKLNESLASTKTGFDLDGHMFETLDEVEKAIKNKAFL